MWEWGVFNIKVGTAKNNNKAPSVPDP